MWTQTSPSCMPGLKSKPWTRADLALLGRIPDSVLARRTRRTIKAIVAERERLRIHMPTGPRRWTSREIRMIGQYTDAELARRLCRPYDEVRNQRLELHIRAFRPKPRWRYWTWAEQRMLGRFPDSEVARRTRRSLTSVIAHRGALGIPKLDPVVRPWQRFEEKLL